MDRRKKGEYIGALGALLVHVAVIALLILVSFAVPQPDEDAGGVPVMMGNVESARGFDDPSLVDVDVLDEEVPPPPAEAEPELPSEQDLLTQAEEETVAIKPKTEEPKKEEKVKPKEVVKPKEPAKKPEKTEAEKAAEAKRLAEEKAERERKAAAEAAKKRVAGAFGKGAQMEGNKGTSASGAGTEGSKEGNSSTGSKTGTGGIGTFDLGGRSLGKGTSLPIPVYNVQEEGRVVVNITVNPAGIVIATTINRQTNTVNSVLRKAAEDAARKARFEAVDKPGNQTGTITYNFKLR
ncbi:energy transducer TonB [uncultured Bacteroides sp.]|uniref:energy transducer TonB family protein n=1 Tax=uncultured Bacteroides sp. TaxID=162156 RepID=UPI0025E35D4B|nr:energy transducer TonB [uncultured Bacteroides sp.]